MGDIQGFMKHGRHTPTRFDRLQYENELFSLMISQATSDGQPKIAQSLERLEGGPDAPPAKPAPAAAPAATKPAQPAGRPNQQQKPRR